MSMMLSDQTPAGIYIANPNNVLKGNRVAGSERYGIWYDLNTASQGVNKDSNVCPEGKKLGEFSNNHVHSNIVDGFTLPKAYSPRRRPCKNLSYKLENPVESLW